MGTHEESAGQDAQVLGTIVEMGTMVADAGHLGRMAEDGGLMGKVAEDGGAPADAAAVGVAPLDGGGSPDAEAADAHHDGGK
jgi:hypothetical protein